MLTKFGSHLYGTDNKDSDLDIKGVFLPSPSQVYLKEVPDTIRLDIKLSKGLKNTKDDIDIELWSIYKFLQLARQGETNALDILHSNQLLHETFTWKRIYEKRSRFYSKNMKAFLGYAQKQAAKYGIKGSRLQAAKDFLEFLQGRDMENRMDLVWEQLPTGEHSKYLLDNPSGIKQYQVCGKIIQNTVTIGYAYKILKKFYDAYGERAKLAARNEGIDWKALSHAHRAADQLAQIYTNNDLVFPLKTAGTLKKIKEGKLDATFVLNNLEAKIERIKDLAMRFEPVDTHKDFWRNWLYVTIKNHIHDLSDHNHSSMKTFQEEVMHIVQTEKQRMSKV